VATFFLAWELGMGAGHCVNLLPVARRLVERGHTVYFAPRDLVSAKRVFGALPVPYLAAPYSCSRPPNAVSLPRTFADILHNTGFGDQETMETLLSAWCRLIEFVQPAVVVCEHAPMALLASHALGRRRVVLGTGFFSPPDVSPMADLRDWLPPEPNELLRYEQAVLARINHALTNAGKAPLARVASLYAEVNANFLLTFAELDHFPDRPPAHYWGMWSPPTGSSPAWPLGDGPRIFAYLKPPMPPWKAGEVLGLLRRSRSRSLVWMPGADPKWLAQFHGSNFSVASGPLDIRQVAEQCDLAILNGNAGTATELLLHGVPQLQIPIYLEQTVFSRRVVQLGAGLMAESHRLDQIAGQLSLLLSSDAYRRAAMQFAQRYKAFGESAQR
jgi:hypothetical protein